MTEGTTPEGGPTGSRTERLLENGFCLVEQFADYGRGRISIIQVIPPTIKEADQPAARKQIYIPGYRPSWVDKPKELERDLITLAELNEEVGRNLITVGIAFIGDRKQSGAFVQDIAADISKTQHEKALDYFAGLSALIQGNNAEIAAHSLGGTIGVAAAAAGLPVDTVGLFNSAGLVVESKEDLYIPTRVPLPMRVASQAVFDRVKGALERRKENSKRESKGRTVLNRIHESRVENYAAYRSLVHGLIPQLEGRKVIIANAQGDKLYPKEKVRRVLERVGVASSPQISLVDLSWEGHNLGKSGGPQRRERLREIVTVMQQATSST